MGLLAILTAVIAAIAYKTGKHTQIARQTFADHRELKAKTRAVGALRVGVVWVATRWWLWFLGSLYFAANSAGS